MVVLVDGYNVTRFLFPRESSSHEAELAFLLTRLARYYALKKEHIHEIMVVLDGGMFSHKTREIQRGVVIVYAGHGRKADDVLVEYGKQFRNGAILVSNDRELQRRMAVCASGSVGVAQFWDMVTAVCHTQQEDSAVRFGTINFTKYSSDDDEGSTLACEVDELLIEGSMSVLQHKHEKDMSGQQRRGVNALSKKEKAVRAMRKKLG
jgi:predicted RNA-binding protein with PIN domain